MASDVTPEQQAEIDAAAAKVIADAAEAKRLADLHRAALVAELQRAEYKGLTLSQAWNQLHTRQTVTTTGTRAKAFTIEQVMNALSDDSAARLALNPSLENMIAAVKANDVLTLLHWAAFFTKAKIITADENAAITTLATQTESFDVVSTTDARIGAAFAGVEGMPNEIDMDEFIEAFNQLNGGA